MLNSLAKPSSLSEIVNCTAVNLEDLRKFNGTTFNQHFYVEMGIKRLKIFVTEETLYIIECGGTMAHYYTQLCWQRTILYSITADSRQGSLTRLKILTFYIQGCSWCENIFCSCWEKFLICTQAYSWRYMTLPLLVVFYRFVSETRLLHFCSVVSYQISRSGRLAVSFSLS